MLKVLVFGYCHGIRSSKKLARLLERDIAFRYLAANHQPDFCTPVIFGRTTSRRLEVLFEEILTTCRKADLVDYGRVALDCQRVQDDAALSANFTRDRLREEVRKLIEDTEHIDEEEDKLYGPSARRVAARDNQWPRTVLQSHAAIPCQPSISLGGPGAVDFADADDASNGEARVHLA